MLVADLVVSCCDCPPPSENYYTNCEIGLENIDNRGPHPELVSSDTLSKKAFGLKLEILQKVDLCFYKTPTLFSSAAYAISCDCIGDMSFLLDQVDKLTITTIQDLAPGFPAGSEVSQTFKLFQFPEFYEVDQLMSTVNTSSYYSGDSIFQTFDLLLINDEIYTGTHQFEIELHLSDGRVLSSISPKVYLQ